MIFAYLGKNKGQYPEALSKLKKDIDKTEYKWKFLQTDDEEVVTSRKVKDFCDKHGIRQRISAPYKKGQNGEIEGTVHLVQDLAATLMFQHNAPPSFYLDAVQQAVHILNTCRVPRGMTKTPYEEFWKEKPNLSNIVPFFSPGKCHVTREERQGKGKHSSKADIIKYLGCPENFKDSYKVWDPKEHREKVRHDCIFQYDKLFEIANLARLSSNTITPKSIREALEGPDRKRWLESMHAELRAQIKLGTFRELDRLKGRRNGNKPVKMKFVFKIKNDGRYKTRLVACGYSQKYGIDYMETYSPTVTFKSVLTLLHIACHNGWYITTCDVGNAYLESNLDIKQIAEIPRQFTEYIGVDPIQVEIVKALYGLKQSGKLWNDLIIKILKKYGFISNNADPCILSYKDGNDIIHIAVYVDDLLIVSSSTEVKNKLIEHLLNNVETLTIHDDDELQFLGIDIEYDRVNSKAYLSQERYATEIIEDYLPDNSVVSSYPISNEDLEKGAKGSFPYMQEIIGKIRYLADRTRPDLLYPLSYLSRYLQSPSENVMLEVVRLLTYIKGTLNHQLIIGSKQKISLVGISDASFSMVNDCKSQLGYCIFLSDDSGAVSNKSCKASTVTISSTQSEVYAAIEVIKEILWFRELLTNLFISVEDPTLILIDNKPTVILGTEGNNMNRSKHFLNKTMFIREQVDLRNILLKHLPGLKNHSDLHTKILRGHQLRTHTEGILGMNSIHFLDTRQDEEDK
jgi:hypothetical protein